MSSVLVDSSIWIRALRDAGCAEAVSLRARLAAPEPVLTTGLIVQEVLQGLDRPADIARVSTLLDHVVYAPARRDTHRRAAALVRRLRRHGFTVGTVDAVIAQVALDHRARVWSADMHFGHIARGSKLRLYQPSAVAEGSPAP